MKLPFKLPSFGRKKPDQEDDDFDPADIEDGGEGVSEDDDEDDEEEGGKQSKRRIAVIGGGAAAGLLLVGGLSWFFLAGGDGGGEKAAAAAEDTGVPKVTMDIAPKRKAPTGQSLNAIAAGVTGPGAGVVAPAASVMAFASLAPPAVSDAPLAGGDDPALREDSPHGPLPIVSEDGRMSWRVYAKPFDYQGAGVAVVVSGLGMSEATTEAAISLLPGNVTLAFDPYSPGLIDWVARARRAGHEAMIMVPLEPSTFPIDDPGPQALMTTNAPEENRMRLEYVLSRSTGFIGVMSVMGSKFYTSDEFMRPFLEEIKMRGLMYLDGGVDDASLGPRLATEIGLPRAVTDIIIDSNPSGEAIDGRLAELENILRDQPAAVAVAAAYPSSIKRLAAWTAGLEAKNLVLVPLSALADRQILK